MNSTNNKADTKTSIIKFLLQDKEASYRNMMEMQEADMAEARKANEDGENLFNGGKSDQVLNRVSGRAPVIEALKKDIDILSGLDSIEPTGAVQLGDVIETDQGTFFAAVAADEFTIDGISYRGISTESPLFRALLGKKNGDVVSVNDHQFTLKNSY